MPVFEYYRRATIAIDRGEFQQATDICLKALKQFVEADESNRAAEAYHLLGTIAYQQEEYEEADSWYRKALAMDERTGNEGGAARTYNNLSAVANAVGEYDSAEGWLRKSIEIKERLADEPGLAASYHQLGVVAKTKGGFDAAEKFYLQSLEIKKRLHNEIGIAKTCVNLCVMAEEQNDQSRAESWRQEAMEAVRRHGRAADAIRLGRDSEQQCKYGEARDLYSMALAIAIEQGDDNVQSLSHLYLGHLACETGDHSAAKEHYEKSIEIDENINATERASRSCLSLGNICLGKNNGGRRDLRSAKMWFDRSLELTKDASWRSLLAVYTRLWYFRLLSVLRM